MNNIKTWLTTTIIGFVLTAVSLTWAITNASALGRYKELDVRVNTTEQLLGRYDERLKSIERQLEKVIMLLEKE